MSYFLKSGNTFRVSAKEAIDLHEKLPAGNYIIKENPMSGELYLEMIDKFEPLKKLYGDTTKNATRIIRTFLERTASTGVMLTGEKGSGKSLLAKTLAIECATQDIPCIVINAPYRGDKFNAFMQTIEQPTMVLFDEFEKVYDRDEQEEILTLLDGVFPSKKLFVLTCNDKWRVDSHMRNRPGRIYYMLDFNGLDAAFITEYCNDNLNAKEHIEKICQIAALFAEFNFDMLKALVEEMNRYNESPADALRMLNAKPEFSENNEYEVSLRLDGKTYKESLHPSKWEGNPLGSRGIHVEVDTDPENDENEDSWKTFRFGHQDLKTVQAQDGKFTFIDPAGAQLTLTKVKKTYFSYDAL